MEREWPPYFVSLRIAATGFVLCPTDRITDLTPRTKTPTMYYHLLTPYFKVTRAATINDGLVQPSALGMDGRLMGTGWARRLVDGVRNTDRARFGEHAPARTMIGSY